MKLLLLKCAPMRGVASMIFTLLLTLSVQAQDNRIITVSADTSYQTMKGFGAALAYYEGWLTDHPNKAEIYDAIFGELSLDILRLRNAYEYDPEMINRAKEFVQAAQNSLGQPIDILVSSWGPPAYLKSNGDRKNGGTLRYTVSEGQVQFDYPGFAHWWNRSMDEYNANGIYPTYVSMQNEPDYTATWESCRFDPSEKINSTDTIAGYNEALRVLHDTLSTRTNKPQILGPETVGIGYNAVENYINALDINLLDGIAHHLYHGANSGNPYLSTDFAKVGAFHPEVPHFQTEYSLGDWWGLAGLIYKSLYDENAAAYIYWELTWDGDGLVSLDFPWNSSQWQDPDKGYTRTKDFFVFKQYSAFIHPGWKRVASGRSSDMHKILTFISPERDSAATVIINRSESEALTAAIAFRDRAIVDADVYQTTAEMNCAFIDNMPATSVICPPTSITTVAMFLTDNQSFVPVESISFVQTDTVIDTWKDTLALQPRVLPENATNSELFWELLSGSDIASVSPSGTLHALGTGDGTVLVQASATDGSGITEQQEITLLNQVLVEEIQLFASAGSIKTPEGTIQFNVEVLPEAAFNKVVSWELISGTEIATLNQDGLLQALGNANGTAEIKVSATDGSGVYITQSISIINQVLAEEILLLPPDSIIDTPGGSIQFSVEVFPEAANKTVTWELTSGSEIASLNQQGLLQALGNTNGTAEMKVSATDGSGVFISRSIMITNQENNTPGWTGDRFKIGEEHGNLNVLLIPSSEKSEIRIYTISGKHLRTIQVPAYSEGIYLNESLDPGIYVIAFADNKGQIVKKITVTE